jgi:lactose/L-arabinose transport system permease protein
MLISATNTSVEVLAGKLTPGFNILENLKNLMKNTNLIQALWNSLRNSIIATIASLFVCSIAGYGFEIYNDKYKDSLMGILLLSMMVPFAVIMIPLFRMFGQANLVNTTTAFVLPMLSTAFLIFLFRQSTRNFPRDVIEAARMEGMGEFNIFLKIYIPMMKPTYATAAIIVFMNAWNRYLWALVILQKQESITIPVLISNLSSGYTINYGALMLSVTISVLPTLIVFIVLQKSFERGITSGIK